MESEVIYYCEDHDNVDVAALSECFGKPEDVAKDFLSELGESAAVEANSIKLKIVYFLLAIITIVVVGSIIHIGYVQHTLLNTEFIESITYEGELTTDITGPTYDQESFVNQNNQGH